MSKRFPCRVFDIERFNRATDQSMDMVFYCTWGVYTDAEITMYRLMGLRVDKC